MKFIPVLCPCILLLLCYESFGQTFRNGKLNGTIIAKDKSDKSHFLQYEFIANEHTYTMVIYRSGAKSERFTTHEAGKTADDDSTSKLVGSKTPEVKITPGTERKSAQVVSDSAAQGQSTPAKQTVNTSPTLQGDTTRQGAGKKNDSVKSESGTDHKEGGAAEKTTDQPAGWGAPTEDNVQEKDSGKDKLKEAIFYEMSFDVFKQIFKAQ